MRFLRYGVLSESEESCKCLLKINYQCLGAFGPILPALKRKTKCIYAAGQEWCLFLPH